MNDFKKLEGIWCESVNYYTKTIVSGRKRQNVEDIIMVDVTASGDMFTF